MALATAAQMREYLRVLTGTAEDSLIDSLIARFDGLASGWCGYPTEGAAPTFESATYTHYFDGDGARRSTSGCSPQARSLPFMWTWTGPTGPLPWWIRETRSYSAPRASCFSSPHPARALSRPDSALSRSSMRRGIPRPLRPSFTLAECRWRTGIGTAITSATRR